MAERGFYNKYVVTKADGSPVDEEAIYFVLRVDKDPAARMALMAYMLHCTNPVLAADLRMLILRLGASDGAGIEQAGQGGDNASTDTSD